MIMGEFFDEVVIRYRTEKKRSHEEQIEQNEANDVNKGYAYINGEKTKFYRFPLLETDLSVMVSKEFFADNTLVITEQTMEMSNHDKSICLSFEFLQHSAEEFLAFNYTESNIDIDEEESHYRLEFENNQIKGVFTCASYREEDWKELLLQMMNSIETSQEEKDGD